MPHLSTNSAVEPKSGLSGYISTYQNNREYNTRIYHEFDAMSQQCPWLAAHRNWVETNQWGFGDRALHYMWYLIVEHLAREKSPIRCLEIGVYKGQIISLWSLIANHVGAQVQISALSPFCGSAAGLTGNRFIKGIRKRIDRKFRSEIEAGNTYGDSDYFADCTKIFDQFDLKFDEVEVFRGFSTDANLLVLMEGRQFDVIYVDGDHTERIATHDVKTFAPKIVKHGLLVMDDASLFLEMDIAYRGRPGASKAADLIPAMGFENILNIGHNRIFRKL